MHALRVMIAFSIASAAEMQREAARRDREERGMLPDLCEACDAEIPEDSAYGSDDEACFVFCEQCTEDAPPISDDAEDPGTDD
jgi:hypothetical protein